MERPQSNGGGGLGERGVAARDVARQQRSAQAAFSANVDTRPVRIETSDRSSGEAAAGEKIGVLSKGAGMVVLQEQDKWLFVNLCGFIWKESVTGQRGVVREQTTIIMLSEGGWSRLEIMNILPNDAWCEVAAIEHKS